MEKKVVVIGIIIAVVAIMVVGGIALAEKYIREDVIFEKYITESQPKGTFSLEKVIPNYVITIGGEKLIDIQVYHHPEWIQAIGNGAEAAKDWCTTAANDVADTVTGTFNNVTSTISGWFHNGVR